MTKDSKKSYTLEEHAVPTHAEVSAEVHKVIPKKEPAVKKIVVPVREKKISFEQFAARTPGIKTQHMAGMRAHVKNPDKLRTETDWATLFVNY